MAKGSFFRLSPEAEVALELLQRKLAARMKVNVSRASAVNFAIIEQNKIEGRNQPAQPKERK